MYKILQKQKDSSLSDKMINGESPNCCWKITNDNRFHTKKILVKQINFLGVVGFNIHFKKNCGSLVGLSGLKG